MLISESMLLQRVQNEMTSSFDRMRKKQELEILELLKFLRKAKVAADPFHSWEAAKLFVDNLNFPAFLMSPSMGIIRANEQLTALLGYEKNECDGWPAARINNIALMSNVGAIASNPPYQNMKGMHLRYFYMHKSGKRMYGLLAVTKIVDGAYIMTYYPDVHNIVDASSITNM
jgi:PAS domain-containing protein